MGKVKHAEFDDYLKTIRRWCLDMNVKDFPEAIEEKFQESDKDTVNNLLNIFLPPTTIIRVV